MSFIFAVYTSVKQSLLGKLSGVTVYAGHVPKEPSYPYVYLSSNVPDATERSLGRRATAVQHRFRTTAVGLTDDSVRIIADKVVRILDGSRFNVQGWVLGKMENQPNDQRIQEDRDVTDPDTGVHPQYAVLDWLITGSRKP